MSNKTQDIHQSLILAIQDPDLIEAFDRVLDSGSFLEEDFSPVKDTNGEGLIREQKYRLNGELVRVKDWQFGAGNMLDRYYYVYYLYSKLDDRRLTVEATYPDGVFGGAKYQSKFAPLTEETLGK